MSFLLDNIPFFHCLVRREYTRNLADRHGEYLQAVAFAACCRRGRMLSFHLALRGTDEKDAEQFTGGAMFAEVPIEALAWKPCEKPKSLDDIAPWDVFSETFTVVELKFIAGGKVTVLPSLRAGRYLFTLDFCGSDLADDPQQHKQLHVLKMDAGGFAAVPNNRLLVHDDAFWTVDTAKRPDFVSLSHRFQAE